LQKVCVKRGKAVNRVFFRAFLLTDFKRTVKKR
jgi:hypothetical protein